ncbi:SMC-Scp complex subunit ScpB [Gemmatimonas aurantiaca]|nr:SMC-Scp complex subunit ScpB [Gemmatimonas aurantiaca]
MSAEDSTTELANKISGDQTAGSDNKENTDLFVAVVEPDQVAPAVEAILFASANPTPSVKLSETLGKIGVNAIKKAIAELNEKYELGNHSFRIRQIGGGYQFFVLPNYSDFVKLLYTKERKLRLTKAALETMAIVAYKQPISKNQIEYIRGVACDGVVSNLLEKSLIKISGRSDGVGRSLLYSATDEFLKFFGLNDFAELPRIAEIEEMIAEMEAERKLRYPAEEDVANSNDENGASVTSGELALEAVSSETAEDSSDPDTATQTE